MSRGWQGGRGKTPFHFTARYAGICACCGNSFPAGTEVQYDPSNKIVIVYCPEAKKTESPEEA